MIQVGPPVNLGGSVHVQAPPIHKSAPGTEAAFCPLASLFIITITQPGFIMFLFEIADFLASSDTDVHFNSSHSALACPRLSQHHIPTPTSRGNERQ